MTFGAVDAASKFNIPYALFLANPINIYGGVSGLGFDLPIDVPVEGFSSKNPFQRILSHVINGAKSLLLSLVVVPVRNYVRGSLGIPPLEFPLGLEN